jgi:hypothetical protein
MNPNHEPGTWNPEPRYTFPSSMSDSPNSKLTATYVWVVVVEAVIIVSLWIVGRLFS